MNSQLWICNFLSWSRFPIAIAQGKTNHTQIIVFSQKKITEKKSLFLSQTFSSHEKPLQLPDKLDMIERKHFLWFSWYLHVCYVKIKTGNKSSLSNCNLKWTMRPTLLWSLIWIFIFLNLYEIFSNFKFMKE